MNKLLFLDTECTGLEAEDRLIQLAFTVEDQAEFLDQKFKAPVPIKIEAMAINHITEEMVSNCPPFAESGANLRLRSLIDEGYVVVAHNAKFDIGMLRKEGIEVPRFICTKKVATYLDEKGVIPSYSLQYLRYFLKLDVEAVAHDAMGDVLVLQALFKRLEMKMSAEEMIEVSSKPMLIRTFNFGKHKGKTLAQVKIEDVGYLQWLLREKKAEAEPDEDWVFSLETHLI